MTSSTVVDALNALDKASFADNVNRLGKAFGVVGKIVQAESIREKTVIGFETGDWKPLGVEIEALAIGSLAAFAAGAFLATVFAMMGALVIISVPFIAVVMALSAAYFDAERIDEINSYFLNLAVGPGEA
ncbi:colicin-like pore-forming protein [Pseudomonas fluorescens]|uniref:colicin-like pore-forming protein n=1 Tax=Pseudomonas fluorescens TaxID=294 RepID=UPI0012424AEA|nr:colicin-like pore-forming protein [Pseudomonas fluorescens]